MKESLFSSEPPKEIVLDLPLDVHKSEKQEVLLELPVEVQNVESLLDVNIAKFKDPDLDNDCLSLATSPTITLLGM